MLVLILALCPTGGPHKGTVRQYPADVNRQARPEHPATWRLTRAMATVLITQCPGRNYRCFPVPDQSTPEVADALELAGWCREAMQRGQTVVVTCTGGLGRNGTLGACLLVGAGTAPEAAIAAVGVARGPRALETTAHEDFMVMFASAIFRGALRLSPPGPPGAPNRPVPASHRLDVSCQVQGHPPQRR